MIGQKLKHKPHQKISELINEEKTPFNDSCIKPYLISLADEEYERVHKLLELKDKQLFKNPQFGLLIERLFQMRNQILSRESRHQEKLIELSIEIISEIYGIPEDQFKWNVNFNLSGFIEPSDEDQDISDFNINPERIPYLKEQVQKRILLNSIVHGSSMHIYKSCFHIASHELRKLSPILPMLYDTYTAILSFLLWQSTPDGLQNAMDNGTLTAQGINSIKFDEEETEIVVEAINFPAMLHEVNKGALDLIICHGLPDDVTEDELKWIYAIADKYSDEHWHYIISPSLWTRFIKHLKLETQELPDAIMKLSKLNLSQLNEIFVSLGKDSEFTHNILKANHVI